MAGVVSISSPSALGFVASQKACREIGNDSSLSLSLVTVLSFPPARHHYASWSMDATAKVMHYRKQGYLPFSASVVTIHER